jgi:tripartite-type tricarboxylate transporter receptor subunit TctC
MRIGETVRAITELPDVRARMSALGMSVDFRDAGQFRDLIAREYEKYGAVAREAGIHPE